MEVLIFYFDFLGVREDFVIWGLFFKKMVVMNYKINKEGS